MHAPVSDCDPEVGRVLFRCGAENLYGQLKSWSVVQCPLPNMSVLESVLAWFDEALRSKQC
jgi:hypothetical protein